MLRPWLELAHLGDDVSAKIHLGREDYKFLFETRRLQTRIMIRATAGVSKGKSARVLDQLT